MVQLALDVHIATSVPPYSPKLVFLVLFQQVLSK